MRVLRGARCGSSARRDLRGGHRATGVPTSIALKMIRPVAFSLILAVATLQSCSDPELIGETDVEQTGIEPLVTKTYRIFPSQRLYPAYSGAPEEDGIDQTLTNHNPASIGESREFLISRGLTFPEGSTLVGSTSTDARMTMRNTEENHRRLVAFIEEVGFESEIVRTDNGGSEQGEDDQATAALLSKP